MSNIQKCAACGVTISNTTAWATDRFGQPRCMRCFGKPVETSMLSPMPAVSPQPVTLSYATSAPTRPPKDTLPNLLLNVCVCKRDSPLYSTMDANAQPASTLAAGSLFSIGGVRQEHRIRRVEAILLDGTRWLLPGDARVFRMKGVKLRQSHTALYARPDPGSKPVDTLSKGAEIVIVDQAETSSAKPMLEVRDHSGRAGYIEATTRVSSITTRPNTAGTDMAKGAAFCLIGLCATIGSSIVSSCGRGMSVIALGPVIFGGVLFLRGFARWDVATTAPLLERLMPQIIKDKTTARY